MHQLWNCNNPFNSKGGITRKEVLKAFKSQLLIKTYIRRQYFSKMVSSAFLKIQIQFTSILHSRNFERDPWNTNIK